MFKKKNILIIFDDINVIKEYNEFLEKRYEVLLCPSFNEFEDYIENQYVSLVVAGLNEYQNYFKQINSQSKIPFLLVIDRNRENEIRLPDSIFIDFIFAPLNKDELYSRIDLNIQKYERYTISKPALSQFVPNFNEKDMDELNWELYKANLELKEVKDLYYKLFTNAPEGILIIDTFSSSVIDANNVVQKLLGYTYNEILGKTNSELFQKSDNNSSDFNECDIASNIDFEEVKNYRNLIIHKNGNLIPVELSVKMIMLDGNIYQQVIILDISERLETERILREAKEKAEEANQLKSNIMTNLSHELRTPLIAILGYSQLLLDELEDEDLKSFIRNIQIGGKRLEKTLSLLLDFSMIANKKITFEEKLINPIEIIESVVEQYYEQITDKNIELQHDINESCFIKVDPGMFKEIISNLINNAVKFTNNGFIRIESKKIEIEKSDYYKIAIIDSGIGIEKEKLVSIFDEFRQQSEGYTREYDGTGLGLTITKKLVELNYGLIEVNSLKGEGACFSVSFPIHHLDKELDIIRTLFSKTKHLDKINILFYEREYQTARIVQKTINNLVNVEVVINEQEILTNLIKNYSAIILDLSLLSVAESIDLVRKVRRIKSDYSFLIICLINSRETFHKELLITNGANKVFVKPFNKEEFQKLFITN